MDERDIANCAFRHITRTSRAVSSAYDRALKPSGLTANQFNVIATLHQAGDQNVKGLAELVGMDSSTVPRVIAPLVQRRLVKVASGDDGRERRIGLTGRGRTRFEEARPLWQAAQDAVIQHLGAGAWGATLGKLREVRKSLRAIEQG